ncbi:hypothetical protein AOZ06_35960 [Kibdelosporangium phytohabitans]|uniref:Carbohydrate-binding module family 96 domain-containing protein n=1 Tax=Kibdelosporangium phytohabitans TaxID=860235 RepID=A0A0N9I5Y4_9PSEU|nr:hypothetical protein AOZ06_35960 [Kibdelosporangium phytohabitans]
MLLVGLIALLVPQTPAMAASSATHQATETGWTAVLSTWPGQGYWNGGPLHEGRAPVGYQGWDAPSTIARSYFMFDTNPVRGKRVLRAEFVVWNSFSSTCLTTPVELWGATAISPQTTWSNQPQRWQLDQRYVPGAGQHCGPSQPISFDITSYVAQVAASGAPDVTFGLAGNEYDRTAFRKFDTSSSTGNRPQLLITYE